MKDNDIYTAAWNKDNHGGFLNFKEELIDLSFDIDNYVYVTMPQFSAHWAMQKTYDYFNDIFKFQSYNGRGSRIDQFYGVPWIGANANAATLFDENVTLFQYGSGDGIEMDPLVSLDVVAHEFTHKVTANKYKNLAGYGLIYEGESGALNESFSDIFATAVEFYTKKDTANWLIGEDVMINYSNMRDMEKPKNGMDGDGPQPDTYQGEFWIESNNPNPYNDYGGVHTNSGVQNYWFYLLCKGGSGVNDKGNKYNVEGIGIDDAQFIVFQNLYWMLDYQASFKDAADCSCSVAKEVDKRNNTGNKYLKSVYNAWYAVGVYDEPYEKVFNAVETVCSDSDFDAYVSNGTLYVRMEIGKNFNVYDANGILLHTMIQSEEWTSVDVSDKNFVIVESEGTTHKCIVKN